MRETPRRTLHELRLWFAVAAASLKGDEHRAGWTEDSPELARDRRQRCPGGMDDRIPGKNDHGHVKEGLKACIGDHRRIGLGNSVVSGSDLGQVLVVNHGPSTGIEGAVDRYVAMTRVTQQLVILTTRDVGQK
jgi:hypothetical protein